MKLLNLKTPLFKKRITLVHLADIIINDLNIKRDDIVLIHTSLRKIKLSDSHPADLIYLLKMIVGSNGTLIMPVLSESTGSDEIVNELFSKMPGTILIKHKESTFSVWGKMAKNISEAFIKDGSDSIFSGLPGLAVKIIGIGFSLPEFSIVFEEDEIRSFRKRGIQFYEIKCVPKFSTNPISTTSL